MKKEFRIKKNKEIEKVLNNRKSIANEYFRLFIFKNTETIHFRYAISVGKKLGKAVHRNKIKRRLRMLFLEFYKEYEPNFDFFLIAKPQIKEIKYEDLKEIFFKSMIKMINKENKQ